ncbi:MAG: ribose transport system ATP-binding protein [Glaciecola sp.]
MTALSGVDFDVRAGEVHCLVGQNGAGKSTLIKTVAGAVAPTRGEVLVDGVAVPPGQPILSIERGIGTIYQELDLVPELTVAQNVFLGHEPRGGLFIDRRSMIEQTQALMVRLDHPQISPATKVNKLRPAAQQIVSIARALSRKVRLLILDEPSAVLDDHEVEALFAVVKRLKAEGVGMVYISHRLGEVRRIGDRVTVLKDGATVATGLPATTEPDALVAHMVGRPMSELFPERTATPSKAAVLEVRNLTLAPEFGDVSFELHEGEILGIGGLVGAGRTELLRAIMGLETYTSGSIDLWGQPLRPGRPDIAVKAGMALAPEERKSQGLLLDWPLVNNVSLPALGRFLRSGLLDRTKEFEAAQKHLQALDTQPDDPTRNARDLSGGNQQKVVLARWLLRNCHILLLDEPTRGVDVGAKAEIYAVIADLAAQGMGVIMVSSELPELVGFCDRILVMADGRIVAEGVGGQMTEADILQHCVNSTFVEAS